MGITVVPTSPDLPPLPRNRPPQEQIDAPVAVRRQVSKELAELEVNGLMFSNWTSVRVEQRWTELFPTFDFECSEEVPLPAELLRAHFVPGNIVRVYLGGWPAVFGYITERHVAYDARTHGVRLVGCGDTVDLMTSVPLEALEGHDGKSLYELAKALSAHLNIAIHRTGAVDDAPFKNIGVLPGETQIQAIDRYAKMRNTLIGSEANGGLRLIGPHAAVSTGALWEGVHILRANVAVRDKDVFKRIFALGQNAADDSANGDPQNKIVAAVDGTSTRNRISVVVADVADTRHGVEQRAQIEKVFSDGSFVEAQITVQGWFKDNNSSDQLWRAGEYYVIDSPSLLFADEGLGCAGCVYEQNAAGTFTTLQMVRPIHMNGRLDYSDVSAEFVRRTAEANRIRAQEQRQQQGDVNEQE